MSDLEWEYKGNAEAPLQHYFIQKKVFYVFCLSVKNVDVFVNTHEGNGRDTVIQWIPAIKKLNFAV